MSWDVHKILPNFLERRLGGLDVLHITNSLVIVGVCLIYVAICLCLPITMVSITLLLRWSPLGIPYHVFGGKEALMLLETSHSIPYYSVLVLDTAVLTGGAFAMFCTCSIFFEGFLRIILITWAVR